LPEATGQGDPSLAEDSEDSEAAEVADLADDAMYDVSDGVEHPG
jgi:hypothetical protein